MSKIEIIDNFLNKDDFEELKLFLMSPRSQWRFVDFIAQKGERDQEGCIKFSSGRNTCLFGLCL